MRSIPVLIVTALVLGAYATVRAQDVAPAAKAEVVRLDVVVIDAQGKPVSDLVREDFDVLEDGKLQRLTDFVFMGGTSAAATPTPPVTTEEPAATSENEQGRGRYIAIVVDELHLSRGSVEAVKAVLRRFLDEIVAADDHVELVLVGSPAGTVQPTRDRATLKQAIARISARRDSIMTGQGAQLTAEQAEQILRGDQSALQLGTRLLADEPGSTLSGSFVPRNTSSEPTPAGVEPGDKAAAIDVQKQARNILAEAVSISESSLGTVEDVLRSMEPLPGRKLCLLVSDGFLVGRGTSEERTRQLRQVADAATRSGTAIYPLVASGLAPIGGDASAVGGAGPAGLRDRVARMAEQQRMETLQGLADDTGGFVVRGSDALAAGLVRMLQDNASVYLLAYEPANQKRDGRFRKLAVRLPRHPDYVVRTRQGYFAPGAKKRAKQEKRAAAIQGPRPLSQAEAQLVLGAPPPQAGIPVRVAADYVELADGGSQAIVKAHVDPAGLLWKKAGERQRAEFDLVGGVYDASGQPVVSPFAGQHYAFDVAPADYAKLKETGVRFETTVPLKPGRYEVRMLALDSGHAPLGGAAQPIEIPDLAQKKLTLSSVFLSSSAATTGAAPGGGAAEALRDAQVLRRFKASDTLYFELYVYNAARDAAGAGDVTLQAQIHSAGKPPFASKPQQALLKKKDGVLLPEGNGMPLSSLAPGSYELRIVVVDKKTNATAARSLDFTVVQ